MYFIIWLIVCILLSLKAESCCCVNYSQVCTTQFIFNTVFLLLSRICATVKNTIFYTQGMHVNNENLSPYDFIQWCFPIDKLSNYLTKFTLVDCAVGAADVPEDMVST